MSRPATCTPVCIRGVHSGVCPCYNVTRLHRGDPATAKVLLKHVHSARYIVIRGNDNQVCCIPLQENDPNCTFICTITHAASHVHDVEGGWDPDSALFALELQTPTFWGYHTSFTTLQIFQGLAVDPRCKLNTRMLAINVPICNLMVARFVDFQRL